MNIFVCFPAAYLCFLYHTDAVFHETIFVYTEIINFLFAFIIKSTELSLSCILLNVSSVLNQKSADHQSAEYASVFWCRTMNIVRRNKLVPLKDVNQKYSVTMKFVFKMNELYMNSVLPLTLVSSSVHGSRRSSCTFTGFNESCSAD